MIYHWDPQKSVQNKKKHGISFEEARDFIFEHRHVRVFGVAKEDIERRHAVIGTWQGKFYTSIFTFTDSGIRIISVRRARKNEEEMAKNKGL